jgi:hypothetical protein
MFPDEGTGCAYRVRHRWPKGPAARVATRRSLARSRQCHGTGSAENPRRRPLIAFATSVQYERRKAEPGAMPSPSPGRSRQKRRPPRRGCLRKQGDGADPFVARPRARKALTVAELRDRRLVIFELLANLGETGEAALLHPKREVLPLDAGRWDMARAPYAIRAALPGDSHHRRLIDDLLTGITQLDRKML